MNQRIHNFNAGPSALPQPVLEQVQAELLNYNQSGMSVDVSFLKMMIAGFQP